MKVKNSFLLAVVFFAVFLLVALIFVEAQQAKGGNPPGNNKPKKKWIDNPNNGDDTKPLACTGGGCTPGRTCCWQDNNGAHQATCQGADGGPGTWGPSIDCGIGSLCVAGNAGTKCAWAALLGAR